MHNTTLKRRGKVKPIKKYITYTILIPNESGAIEDLANAVPVDIIDYFIILEDFYYFSKSPASPENSNVKLYILTPYKSSPVLQKRIAIVKLRFHFF
jgi:hypothetical protein